MLVKRVSRSHSLSTVWRICGLSFDHQKLLTVWLAFTVLYALFIKFEKKEAAAARMMVFDIFGVWSCFVSSTYLRAISENPPVGNIFLRLIKENFNNNNSIVSALEFILYWLRIPGIFRELLYGSNELWYGLRMFTLIPATNLYNTIKTNSYLLKFDYNKGCKILINSLVCVMSFWHRISLVGISLLIYLKRTLGVFISSSDDLFNRESEAIKFVSPKPSCGRPPAGSAKIGNILYFPYNVIRRTLLLVFTISPTVFYSCDSLIWMLVAATPFWSIFYSHSCCCGCWCDAGVHTWFILVLSTRFVKHICSKICNLEPCYIPDTSSFTFSIKEIFCYSKLCYALDPSGFKSSLVHVFYSLFGLSCLRNGSSAATQWLVCVVVGYAFVKQLDAFVLTSLFVIFGFVVFLRCRLVFVGTIVIWQWFQTFWWFFLLLKTV